MAEARDKHSKAKKPVIEVITTVSERANRHMVEPRPAYYGSECEVSSFDEDDYGANMKKVMKTEIFVHSEHLSKWIKKGNLIFTDGFRALCARYNNDHSLLEPWRSNLVPTQQSSHIPLFIKQQFNRMSH